MKVPYQEGLTNNFIIGQAKMLQVNPRQNMNSLGVHKNLMEHATSYWQH